MPIPEDQLNTWSKQGSVTQSRDTYATLKSALEENTAGYGGKSYEIFLQGSYGNDTNIYADSDVDVVIKINSVYYEDTSNLSPGDLALYNAASSPAQYSFNEFKRDVKAQLVKKFGSAVKPGNKAIFVQGNGLRRDADVVPAAKYRKYLRYNSTFNQEYIEGIVFWATDGTQIINYPKKHSAHCTIKHQATNTWFKPSVRVLKNMRNSMVAKGYLADGVAPSYFLEGALYNVPIPLFAWSYSSTISQVFNWLRHTDRAKLVCANEQYYLLHPTSPVTWRAEKMDQFLQSADKFWNEWGRVAA